jgi:2-aminoadipate transaminase
MRQVVTFDEQPPPGTINFGVGQPSADMLPLNLVMAASKAFFDGAEPFDLNYGVLRGDARFIDSLATFLTERYGFDATPEQLFVTGGNSQGLDLSSLMFAKSGDTVFVEEPSFFLAFQIFRDHGLNIVSIPLEDDGLDMDALQRELRSHKPAFLYTISSYHNPAGQCTSEAKRRAIVDLAVKHDFLVLADEVYQLLYYYEPPAPAYGTMASSNRVVSLGSFSKILAPGMRLGWIQTSVELRKRIEAGGYINSGGSVNHISSHIVRQAIDNGSLHSHIDKLRATYRRRLEAMEDALHHYFDGIATWTRPEGGYFFWVQLLDESFDTTPLREAARQRETGFMHGMVFSTSGQFRNCLRLCFAHYNEDDIREGISRLRPLFD